MPHDGVVAVCVDAQVGGSCPAILKDGFEDAFLLRHCGNAVDDVVGQAVVEPLAFVNLCISGFRRGDAGKGRGSGSVGIFDEIAVAVLDVVLENLFRWIAVGPLMHVSCCPHDFS